MMVTGPANADTETTDRSLRCPLIGRNSREWSTFGRWFSYRHDTLAETSFHFGSSRTSFCSTLTNNTLLHSSGYCSLFFCFCQSKWTLAFFCALLFSLAYWMPINRLFTGQGHSRRSLESSKNRFFFLEDSTSLYLFCKMEEFFQQFPPIFF